MLSPLLDAPDAHRLATADRAQPDPAEVLQQLERIATSPLFRNSKRYPAFLRFTVEHVLAGKADMLKERTIGVEVFGRASNYDTNADPVVRITAGEIRKRLAQYYQIADHEHELRFDLLVGSYVPHFDAPHGSGREFPVPPAIVLPPDPQPLEGPEPGTLAPKAALHSPTEEHGKEHGGPAPRSAGLLVRLLHSRLALAVVVAVLLLSAGLNVFLLVPQTVRDRGTNFIWQPLLRSDQPVLIVLGVHSLGPDGRDLSPADQAPTEVGKSETMLSAMTSSDMVPVSDVVSYSAMLDLLSRHRHSYRTQSSSTTSFEQLQHGPVVLIGGLDNQWTLRFTSGLRFHFGTERGSVSEILDGSQEHSAWAFDNAQRAVANSKDYALVVSFQEPQTEQHMLIAAGIGKSGTAAAAQFLTSGQYLSSWIAQARLNGKSNVELVLATDIVGGQQGPPHVVAEYAW